MTVKADVPLPINTPVSVVAPVPPLATGSVPVTPVVNGRPVRFVATPLAGVPSAGVTNTGDVSVTTVPFVVAPVMPPKAPALLY